MGGITRSAVFRRAGALAILAGLALLAVSWLDPGGLIGGEERPVLRVALAVVGVLAATGGAFILAEGAERGAYRVGDGGPDDAAAPGGGRSPER
jgi:hypothetical protein